MKIREFIERGTQVKTDGNMRYLNKILKYDKEMSDLPVRSLSILSYFLIRVGNLLSDYVLKNCKHENLVPEKWHGEHKGWQTCSECFAERRYEKVEKDEYSGLGWGRVGNWNKWHL